MEQKPLKLLLIEDNPGDARLLREMLAEVSYPRFELTHVEQLGDGLKRLDAENFDAVLLDLSLADSSRLQSLVRIHSQASKVPLVVLTGLDDETIGAWAMQEGAQDYLVKGRVDTYGLVHSIRYAIERHRIQPGLLHPAPRP